MYYKIEQKSNYISVVGINISIVIYNKYNTYNIDIIAISVLFPAHCGIGKGKEELWGIGLELALSVWIHGLKKYININVYILFPALFSEKFQSNDTSIAMIYWFLNTTPH